MDLTRAIAWGIALCAAEAMVVAMLPQPFGMGLALLLPAAALPALWLWYSGKHYSRGSRQALQRSEESFRSLVEASMDGAILFDEHGRIFALNGAAQSLFEADSVGLNTGNLLVDVTQVEDHPLQMSQLLDWPSAPPWCSGTSPERRETTGHRRDGTSFVAEVTCTPLAGVDGINTYCAHVRDMTEHRRLAEVGQLLRTCVAHISDSIVVTETYPIDEPGPRIVFVNEAIERMTGFTPAQLLGHSPRIMQGPETSRDAKARIHAALQAGEPAHEEVINYTSSGQPFWLEMRIMPVPPEHPGGKSYFVGIGRDITSKKQQEQRLQQSEAALRRMNTAQQSIREEERARIARDLHDDLGQTLTAMKLELGLLLDSEPALSKSQHSRLSRLVDISDGAVNQIRDIAANLRPSQLDHLGFLAAAQWYVEDADRRVRAKVRFEAGMGAEDPLPSDVAINLYRILQEALTNIIRHAHATAVLVKYFAPQRQPELVIKDDGCGFDPSSVSTNSSLGLLGMRERVEGLGGVLTVDSAPGCGCTLTIKLRQQNEED